MVHITISGTVDSGLNGSALVEAMKRGTKPTPRNLKLVRGNPNKQPINEQEPQPAIKVPKPPAFLNAVAKRHFTATAIQLAALGIMTEIDRDALAIYAQAFATWREAVLKVGETGAVYKTTAGNIIQHPHFGVANKASEQMRKMLAEFGMTPSSRTRIKVDGGEGDGWEDL